MRYFGSELIFVQHTHPIRKYFLTSSHPDAILLLTVFALFAKRDSAGQIRGQRSPGRTESGFGGV
jgi:hypothetical protein